MPTIQYGFSTSDKWTNCWGEVFKIYADGKVNGAVINSGDDIMLYYVHGNDWMALGTSGSTFKSTCPKTSFPPNHSKYDECGDNLFNIQKKYD